MTTPPSSQQRHDHEQALIERVLQLEKWPHLRLLLDDIKRLAAIQNRGEPAVFGQDNPRARYMTTFIERTALYGGYSLFAPFFDRVESYDCSPNPIGSGYQTAWLDDERFIRHESARHFCRPTDLPVLHDGLAIVPNLLHHVPDPFEFLDVLTDTCRRLYIYEVALEEIHQAPNHWGFFTPYGLQTQLHKKGFHVQRMKTTGNAATVSSYFAHNLKEYCPDAKTCDEHIQWCDTLADSVMTNQYRDRTQTIMAYSLYAIQP